MKIIRQKVFETNSSSSHSISIIKTPQEFVFPKKICFELHEFHDYPWDGDDMTSLEGRANYLYAVAVNHWKEEEFEELMKDIFKDTELIFERVEKQHDDEDDEYWETRYLINHECYDDTKKLLDVLMNDRTLLLNYLLDDKTEVALGRDGCEWVTGGEDRFVIGNTEEIEGWNWLYG